MLSAPISIFCLALFSIWAEGCSCADNLRNFLIHIRFYRKQVLNSCLRCWSVHRLLLLLLLRTIFAVALKICVSAKGYSNVQELV